MESEKKENHLILTCPDIFLALRSDLIITKLIFDTVIWISGKKGSFNTRIPCLEEDLVSCRQGFEGGRGNEHITFTKSHSTLWEKWVFCAKKYCFLSKLWRVKLTCFGCWDIWLLDSTFCDSVISVWVETIEWWSLQYRVFQKSRGSNGWATLE